MAITPTGSPAWARTNDHTSYGGNDNLKNYQSQGAINPQTDVDAAEYARLTADAAAVSRTAPFAVLRITARDTATDDPNVLSVLMMTGVYTTTYDGGSAPSGFPGVTRNGDGDYTITFAASYTDDYGVSQDTDIRSADVTAEGSAMVIGTVELIDNDSNTKFEQVRVRLWDSAGAAETDVTATVTVY